MNKFVIFTKSYSGDFQQCQMLADSIRTHNKDNIPWYISVPASDIKVFSENFQIDNENVTVLCDDEIYGGVGNNWFSQQLIKSSAWKVVDCENYLCIDSDGYFIKDFYLSDFMYNEKTPYTVCHQQKELFSWTADKHHLLGFNPADSFEIDRRKVMDVFGRKSKIVHDFGPVPVIWSTNVWKMLHEILESNGMTYFDALKICPSEFTWYGETIMNTDVIDLIPIDPIFKVYHYYQQYLDDKQRGLTEEHLAQNYLGLVLQSTFPTKVFRY